MFSLEYLHVCIEWASQKVDLACVAWLRHSEDPEYAEFFPGQILMLTFELNADTDTVFKYHLISQVAEMIQIQN